jgi:diketogulonate reductase-like aldo/keto reductase
MKYETIEDVTLPKIGFGTWQIGGKSQADLSTDEHSISSLRSALELGYTHFDTAEHYANGHAEELVGQAIRASGIAREKIFITSKVWPNHLRYDDTIKSCEASLRRLKTEYLDLYLIHWHNPLFPLPDTFRALNRLFKQGKVRHLGVSNFDVALVKQAQNLADTAILTNQVPYSLSDRRIVRDGTLLYCQQNDILVTAYEPIKGGDLPNNRILQSIAKAHGASIYQVALAWLVSQQRVITIPMSFKREHQAENLAAAELELTASEIEQLNKL